MSNLHRKETVRDVTWDYARGIAIVMIVLHHLYPRFYIDPAVHPDSIVYFICYTCQLPIFMFVSGLFANSSANRYGTIELIKNRIVRLLLPFFSFILIWALIVPESIPRVFFENFKDGYWFTFVLFEMMVILAVCKYLSKKTNKSLFLFIVVFYVLFTIYELAIPRINNTINGLFSLNLVWHYFPFFIMGYYSNMLSQLFQMRFAAIYALLYAIAQFFFIQYENHALIPLCNIFSLLLVITLFTHGIRPFERTFANIGFYSLQIYLLHFFLRLFINEIEIRDNPIEDFLLNVVLTASTIIISILVARLIMKNEALALLLFGIKKKKQFT